MLITTIWNRINNSLLVCTHHTGTNCLIYLTLKVPETLSGGILFKSNLNKTFFKLRSTYHDRLLWVPNNDESYISSPGVYHKRFNFDELIICMQCLSWHWLAKSAFDVLDICLNATYIFGRKWNSMTNELHKHINPH